MNVGCKTEQMENRSASEVAIVDRTAALEEQIGPQNVEMPDFRNLVASVMEAQADLPEQLKDGPAEVIYGKDIGL